MADRNVSPPPTKRQRLSATSLLATSLPSRPITALEVDCLRVFSWNVNGVASFLQPSITSFFSKSPACGKEGLRTRIGSPIQECEKSRQPPRNATIPPKYQVTPDPTLGNETPSLATCLRRWKCPSVVCLQEVKISPKDVRTQQAVRRAVKTITSTAERDKGDIGYTAHFNLPRDKFNARGFGGKVCGVCTLVRNDVIGNDDVSLYTKLVDWDLEGRVLCLELRDRKVVVFNVYAVNGTENVYHDPCTGTVSGTRHDRKRSFHTELARECRKYEESGWVVVVAGDLNIARSPNDGFPGIRLGAAHVKNRADFEMKFMSKNEGLGMLDSFRVLHDEERKYSYRARGVQWGASCDRVDMILVSHEAGKAVVEADILDEELERGPSDHVPIYATLAYPGKAVGW